jgi:hypothetical protein
MPHLLQRSLQISAWLCGGGYQARVTTTSPNASPNRDAGNTIPSMGDTSNGDAIPNGDANTPE